MRKGIIFFTPEKESSLTFHYGLGSYDNWKIIFLKDERQKQEEDHKPKIKIITYWKESTKTKN